MRKFLNQDIRSFLGISKALGHPFPSSSLPSLFSLRRSTSIDFVENQLSPSLISLSPLATSHPYILQQIWVRSSKQFYLVFNLLMARSLDFGSHSGNIFTVFMFAFTSPPPNGLSLLSEWTRWPIMQKVPSHDESMKLFTWCEWKHWISEFYFTPYLGFFSPFPHGTCSLSIIESYLGLEGGPPIFKNLQRLFTQEKMRLGIQGYHLILQEIPFFSTKYFCFSCLFRFRSPLLTESLLMFFPSGT